MARTRIAPSPTGFPHIGTIYQSLFDKAYALKTNGEFVWRLEDTDQARTVEGGVEALMEAFSWFKLTPDESIIKGGPYAPYKQSERLDIYQKYAKQLVDEGNAYYCFCTPERLAKVREKKQKNKEISMYDKHCRNLSKEEINENLENKKSHVIRMKVPENEKIVCNDLIRGDIDFDSNLVDDQVILKSDGFPTYHLAVVVDDHLMKITDAVRGPEWITSFPKHKLLYKYFGWDMPRFIHTPLITNMNGSKLSKRNGHSSIAWYRKKGFLYDAILNFISLLGWSHPEEKEIFDFEEFVKCFDLKDLSAVNPKFDLQKLEWMNGQYMKNLSDEEFLNRLFEWIDFNLTYKIEDLSLIESNWDISDYEKVRNFVNSLSDNDKKLFSEINKGRIKTFEDLLPMNSFFINEIKLDMPTLYKYKGIGEVTEHFLWFKKEVESINDWKLENLKQLELKVKDRALELDWKVMEVFYPIRIGICRDTISPPLFESIYLLGKEKTLNRLTDCLPVL